MLASCAVALSLFVGAAAVAHNHGVRARMLAPANVARQSLSSPFGVPTVDDGPSGYDALRDRIQARIDNGMTPFMTGKPIHGMHVRIYGLKVHY